MALPTFKLVAPNFHSVTIGGVTVWFSYETPVAFQRGKESVIATVNEFSASTGKHINLVAPDKASRRPLSEFNSLLTSLSI
jgi:hypothetical protein